MPSDGERCDGALRRIWRALCGVADALGCEQALAVGKGCRVMAGGQAAIAQLVARGSHNPKVVSSILTGRIFRSSSFFQLWDHFFHSPVELENKIHLFFQLLDHFFQLTLQGRGCFFPVVGSRFPADLFFQLWVVCSSWPCPGALQSAGGRV